MTTFQQVTFLGASIRSFTSHIGWGNQTSTLSVELAEDPRNFDLFSPPAVGTSVYFDYLGWTFGGILQSWRKTRGEQGNALYSVNVEDPRDFLSGVNLIISNYTGAVNVVPNLYNIYGHIEDEEGFGAANLNENGMSWTKIRDSFNTLQASSPMRLRSDSIYIDLSQLPAIPDSHRVSGPIISLMDFIADICSAGSRDFFFTYSVNNGQNTLYLITIDRSRPATRGAVTTFLSSLNGFNESELGVEFRNEATSKFLIGGAVEKLHATPSQESPAITNANFPEGSNRTIWPYFGLKEDLTGIRVLEPKKVYPFEGQRLSSSLSIEGGILGGHLEETTNGLIFDTFITDVRKELSDEQMEQVAKLAGLHTVEFYNPAVEKGLNFKHPFDNWYNRASKLYKTDLNELRAALGGQDAWETYLQMNAAEYDGIYNPVDDTWYYYSNTHYGKNIAINIIGLHNGVFLDNIINAANNPNIDFGTWLEDTVDPLLFTKTRQQELENGQEIQTAEEVIAEIYETVRAFAQEYFGRKYLVSVPSVGAKFDPEETTVINDFRGNEFTVELNGKIITSLEPTDGGFVDESEFKNVIANKLLPKTFAKLMLDNGKIQAYVRYLYLEEDGESEKFSIDLLPSDSYVHDDRYIYLKCDVEPDLVFLKTADVFSPRAVITLPNYLSTRDATETWLRNELAATIKGVAAGAGKLIPGDVNDPIAKIIDDLIKTGMGADLLNEPVVPMFVVPTMAIVPLRDNTQTYGPWYAAGANGKSDAEVDEQMVPWNFGSYELMNAAGNAKVVEGASQQQEGETGSVTFAGVPVINIGISLIEGGPYVTDVQVNIGEGGATTTYNFQTWTRQFGTVAKEMIENARKQRLLNNKNAQRNFKNKKSRLAQFQPVQQGGQGRHSKRNRANSSHPLIAAQKSGSKNNIVIAPPYNIADKVQDLEDKYIASLDTIFTPFSTNFDGSGGSPHFERPSGNYPISSSGLNPFSYPHNFTLMTRADPEWDEDSLHIQNSGEDDVLGYKTVALRGPLVIAGWGYDINGKPVPSKQGSPNEFADDYKVNQSKWKVGPVDCRWDDTKKIWVASGGNSIKRGYLRSTVFFRGSGLCDLVEFVPNSGRDIRLSSTYVFDYLLPSGSFISSDTNIFYMEEGSRNYIVQAACNTSPEF